MKKIGEGAAIGGFGGGVFGTTIQFKEHGVWDMDPRVEIGLIIIGALVGAGVAFWRTRRAS